MIRSTEQTLYRLNLLNKQQERISYQMSSKEKLQYGSDDANLYTREIYIDDKIRVYEGLETQINKSAAQNKTSDSTLKEAKDLVAYVKAEVLKGLNSTTDADARKAIAVNLKGVKENIFMLSNEQVEGEYLFTGSNSIVKPFEMDANGKVTYNGDAQLRKIAVEDGSYRERGVNGFETFLYTSGTGLKGENLEFSADERIIDQNRAEWKFEAITPTTNAGDTISFNANEPLIDENGTTWTYNSASNQLEDKDGKVYAGTITGNGPFTVTVPNSSGNETLGKAGLVKYDEERNPTTSNMPVTLGTNKDYVVTLPNEDGTKFEAKANMFDVMDKVINALEGKDIKGNGTTQDEALALLREGLGEIDEVYTSMNVGHAKLGGRNKVFEISLERVTSKLNQYNILSHEVGGVDLSRVAVEAKALELTYTALYSTINRTNELSLVNFIR